MTALKRWIGTHPTLWEFILFNLLSNCATIVNFLVMWLCTGLLFTPLRTLPFRFLFFDYTDVANDLGLCGFLSFLAATAAAQAVNFFVQKNLVFRSNAQFRRAVPKYILLAVVLVLLSAALPVLGLLGYGLFAAFLGGNVTRTGNDRRRLLVWGTVFCLVLTALQLVCQGNFGPTLTARADTPFFLMVKGIGIEGTFQRVESLIIALWVFSDLALLALLASSCAALAQAVFSLKERRHAAVPVAAAALAGAWLLFPDAFSLDRWMENVVWPGNLLLGFGLPVLLLLVKKLRGQV